MFIRQTQSKRQSLPSQLSVFIRDLSSIEDVFHLQRTITYLSVLLVFKFQLPLIKQGV